MRRAGASTLAEKDDAGIQSLEKAVTEADELIEKGDESRARRLLLAELAARYSYGHDEQGHGHLPQAPVGNVPVGAASGWPGNGCVWADQDHRQRESTVGHQF